ncbi:MAG: PEGA domain-containing protein [Spirochaetaceae bacterium]|nr:MAG: PEGA domain-containing protein [Spirochaetaceae bacterium]
MKQSNSERKTQAKDRSQPVEEVSPVTLKPVFGIEPGKWLTVILVAAICVVLSVLLVLPGIINRHVVYQFESTPPSATVHLNGQRIGATPLSYAVPAGSHTVTVVRPHFAPEQREIEAGGRIVGSLFASERQELSFTLRPASESDPASRLMEDAALDFSRWAALGAERADRPVPAILVPAVRDLQAMEVSDAAIQEFLLARIEDVTYAPVLDDLTQALVLTGDGIEPPRMTESDEIVSFFEQFEVVSHTWLRWLVRIFPSSATETIRDSRAYQTELEVDRDLEHGYGEAVVDTGREAGSTPPRRLGGTDFRSVPSGELLQGFGAALGVDDRTPTRRRTDVASFLIATAPVSVNEFQTFIEAHPEWAPEARDELVSAGLVDTGYLADFNTQPGTVPVTGVSWHAARAYAAWFNETHREAIASLGSGFEARLPNENEWAWAAILDRHAYDVASGAFSRSSGPATLDGTRTGRLGLEDMLGNVWEWMNDPWYRASSTLRIEGSRVDAGLGPSFPRVVRGGSWANPRAAVGTESRGGQEAHWATPFLGFRLVIGAQN